MTRARRESGAVVPMIALLLAVLIPSTAIAVDLGMQRVVRRDLQALADMVALDLVRLVDGRTAAQIESGYNGHPTLEAAKGNAVARNDTVLGDNPTVTAMLVRLDQATGQLDRNADGSLRQVQGDEVPNAVRVQAVGAVDFAFRPGRGGSAREAVAVLAPSACFRLGSFAAGVSSDEASLLNSVLPELLGNPTINATAVGYQGLAAANVSLLDLVGVESLGVGTVQELLELEGLTVAGFYAATATALQNNGGPAAAVTLLHYLSSHVNLTSQIAIADVLSVLVGDSAALAADFNVLDLVVGAAYAANDTNSLAVPGLSVFLPGVAALSTSLAVGEAPKPACGAKGRAKAETGQVRLELDGSLADVDRTVSLPLLSGTLVARTHVEAEVFLAQATGVLTEIVCGDATSTTNAEGIDVAVSSSLASTMAASETIQLTGTLDLKQDLGFPLGTVKVATVTVNLSVDAAAPPSSQATAATISFRHPDDVYGVPKSYGSGIALNSITTPSVDPTADVHVNFLPGYGVSEDVDVASITGLQAALNDLLATATNHANSQVVSPLNTTVTPLLAHQIGVKVGGADVFALPRPSCDDPRLAG